MTQAILMEHTRQLLEEPLLGDQDLNTKVLLLLEAEYMRRLKRYQRVNRNLSQKYGVTFDEFLAQEIVKQFDYRWEVEQDAMGWETAIDGVATMQRKLRELKGLSSV